MRREEWNPTESALFASGIDGVTEAQVHRQAFEAVFDYTFIKDPEGLYRMVNPAMAAHLGKSREEIIGLRDTDLFEGQDQEKIEAEDARVLAGERIEDRRYRAVAGEHRCYHIIKVPLRDDEGEIRGICGVVRDVTDQARMADDLGTISDQLQGLTYNLPGLAFSYLRHPDGSRTGLYSSPGLEDLVGDSAAEEIRRDVNTWDTLIHPDDLAGVSVHRSNDGGNHRSFDMEYRLRNPEGDYRWVHTISHGIVQSDGDVLWHGILLDVDDRKRMQAELEETSERQRNLTEGLPGVVYSFVGDARDRRTVLYCGAGLEELVGPVNAARILQEDEFLDLLLHPDDFGKQTVSRAPGSKGRLISDHEYRIRQDSGAYRWVHSRASGQDIGNDNTLWHGFLLDIDDRKRAEEQLHQASERLRIYSSSLEESNRSLNEAKAQAEAASLAKGQFLANMSHEIRTPLTGILGLTDILVERMGDTDGSDILAIIRKNGEFLLKIINDILDLSKIEAGRLTAHESTFDPARELREVAELMSVPAELKGLDLLLEIEPSLPAEFFGDATRLRQILINLLGNAVKFTESGQVILRADFVGGEAPELRIDVIDTGIGIDPVRVEELFEAFVQGDGSSSRSFEGTGLGLTISKSLAELMGGRLDAERCPEGGSRFRLSLPGSAPTARSEDDRRYAEITDLSAHVLLAEDNVTNQMIVQTILEQRGCSVEIAADGAEALEIEAAARKAGRPFDLILMDIQMPVMDGLAATRALRAAGNRRPIIALTAHAFEKDRRRFVAAGCNDHCGKPIDIEQLVGMIARHVENRKPGEEA